MKLFITSAIAAQVAVAVALTGPALAAAPVHGDAAPSAFAALAGTALPAAQLGGQRARGVVIGNTISSATVDGNYVGSGAHTGTIADTGSSISNNVGITTVFQNTGNNSLLQNSMTITINAH